VHNVFALATMANSDQWWACQVCGKKFGYSQPIDYALQLNMLKLFKDWHNTHCKPAQ